MGNSCCCCPPSAAVASRPAITTTEYFAIHKNEDTNTIENKDDDDEILSKLVLIAARSTGTATGRLRDAGFEFRLVPCEEHASSFKEDVEGIEISPPPPPPVPPTTCCCCCFKCATRLFHLESGNMITSENRK